MSNNPKFQIAGGVTPVPNWIFDSQVLTPSQKLVAWGFHRRCYGAVTSTDASIKGIARDARLDPKTASAAVEALVSLEVLVRDGPRPDGLSQPFKLVLERPPKLVAHERAKLSKTKKTHREMAPKGTPVTHRDSTPDPSGNRTEGGGGNGTPRLGNLHLP